MEENKVKKLSTSRLWLFALSDNGYFIAMNLFTVYPIVFMTRCLGIAASVAVSIVTIGKLIDIFVGLMIGTIIEKVRLPWGKYRSWLLVAPIISGIAAVLFFSPLLQNAGAAVVPVGALLIAMWNFGGNLCRTVSGSLNNVLTNIPAERVEVSKLGMQLQGITGFLAGLVMMPIVYAVGRQSSINLAGMQAVAIMFSLLYFALYFLFFLNLRDLNDGEMSGKGRPKAKMYDAIQLFFTNGKVFSLTFAGLVCNAAQTLLKGMISFVFLYVLYSDRQLDMFNYLTVIAAFLGATIVTYIAKRLSKKATYALGYFIFTAALILGFFLRDIPYAVLVCVCLAYLGMNFARPVGVPMYSDVADYIRIETGENKTSIVMTVFNLQFKISGFIATAGTSLILFAGYQTGVDPSPAIQTNIAAMAMFVPAALALAGSLCMLFLYRLDEKKLNEMRAAAPKTYH